jgi:DDE superfamily endonuclease
VLNYLKKGWNILVEDESIFIYDTLTTKRRKWITRDKRPVATVTGSHDKTIVYGALSLDGKQIFRQDIKFDSPSFIAYLEVVKKKFKKFVIFLDRAAQHRSKMVEEYLHQNMETIRVKYFPVGSSFLNAVEECWRQGKGNILSNYYSSFTQVKQAISNYYRKRRFNLDIQKYLFRSTN